MGRPEGANGKIDRHPAATIRDDLIAVVLLLLLAFVVVPTALQSVLQFGPANRLPVVAGLLQGLLIIAPSVALLLAVWGRVRQLGFGPANLGLAKGRIGRDLGVGIGYGGLLTAVNLVATQASLALLERVFGSEAILRQAEAEQLGILQLFGPEPNPLLITYVAFAIVIVTPIAEELFFRGYAYPVFRARLGVRGGLWATAGLFALVHLYVVHLVPVALLGWLLGWMYERTGSLVVPIVAHAVGNSAAVLTMLIYLAQ